MFCMSSTKQLHAERLGHYDLLVGIGAQIHYDNSLLNAVTRIVLYRATHWLRFWSQLERNDQKRKLICSACVKLETVAMQHFINHGWRFSNRICY
jgi:hypothetical protein